MVKISLMLKIQYFLSWTITIYMSLVIIANIISPSFKMFGSIGIFMFILDILVTYFLWCYTLALRFKIKRIKKGDDY